MSKIDSVTLRNFRGITGECALSFLVNGKPVSAFILGDNGSGKSSIADAIEFCLQGTLFNGSTQEPMAPTLRNLYAARSEICTCRVQLDSSEAVTRSSRPGERSHYDVKAHADFRYSAFVLRRRDLARFSETTDRFRPAALAGFLRIGKENWLRQPSEESH
ncbi:MULTISPECIES: AAA family ATPase, partial [unclassified Frankia]